MSGHFRHLLWVWVSALLLLILAGCGVSPPPELSSAPTPPIVAAAPTIVPSASPTAVPSTATITVPASPSPSATPRSSATPSPVPSGTPTATAAPSTTPTPAPSPTEAPSATPLPPTFTPVPTQPLAPTLTPVPALPPSPTPDPFAPWTIESLRQRGYAAGPITIGPVLVDAQRYASYTISYPSDGLRITGILHRPKGEGPFPVLLLNHGYYDPGAYRPGDGTRDAAIYFAERGYLTIASDYRNYGGSDRGENPFRLGFVIDVVSLLNALPTLPNDWADTGRVGMWGHSMGGAVTINTVAIVGSRVRAAVIYGGMSGDMAAATRHVLTMWQRPDFVDPVNRWGGPDAYPDAYARMSALNHLGPPQAALSIHHGSVDEQVPYPWSETLRDRALASGLRVEHFMYPGAPHNFAGETWQLFMARCADFFARELAP